MFAGSWLFDSHVISPIQLRTYHTGPRPAVKEKPGFLAAKRLVEG
jgi:hypothetical protein